MEVLIENSSIKNRKKHLVFLLLGISFWGCSNFTNVKHYHDGKYYASYAVYDVIMEINGGNLKINNSVTGIAKFDCVQYKDRIEYQENDSTLKVLKALDGGSLQLNKTIVFRLMTDSEMRVK